ncbi:MAG: hypothetical protein IJD67_04020, partial [Clostridia bacterium]|nr:hypothetical protein [Clostridia bacterium]
GGFCDNLLIKNNIFDNCASLNNGFGVVHISSSHDNIIGNYKCKRGHTNVSLIDNKYVNCKNNRLRAYNVQNLYESDEK